MLSYARALLVDSGFVIAAFSRHEHDHAAALDFLSSNRAPLVTLQCVLSEACFFLRPKGRAALLQWVARAGMQVAELPATAYDGIAALVLRYAALDPDFTDCALVWFAGQAQCRRILTLDERDFTVYRLPGNRRFDIVDWQSPPAQ